MSANKYKIHQQSSTQNATVSQEEPETKTTVDADVIASSAPSLCSDESLLRYARKESIADQIKCNHALNTKCINCVSRRLLPFRDKALVSLKSGLFNLIFSTQRNRQHIQDLVQISRTSRPNSMRHFQSQSSLQYGEITLCE